jgi:hypothetical protein
MRSLRIVFVFIELADTADAAFLEVAHQTGTVIGDAAHPVPRANLSIIRANRLPRHLYSWARGHRSAQVKPRGWTLCRPLDSVSPTFNSLGSSPSPALSRFLAEPREFLRTAMPLRRTCRCQRRRVLLRCSQPRRTMSSRMATARERIPAMAIDVRVLSVPSVRSPRQVDEADASPWFAGLCSNT